MLCRGSHIVTVHTGQIFVPMACDVKFMAAEFGKNGIFKEFLGPEICGIAGVAIIVCCGNDIDISGAIMGEILNDTLQNVAQEDAV